MLRSFQRIIRIGQLRYLSKDATNSKKQNRLNISKQKLDKSIEDKSNNLVNFYLNNQLPDKSVEESLRDLKKSILDQVLFCIQRLFIYSNSFFFSLHSNI